MEEWKLLLVPLATSVATAQGKAIILCLLLAIPLLVPIVTRTIWPTAALMMLAAYPLWLLATEYVSEAAALWMGLTWQIAVVLCVFSVRSSIQRRHVAALMARIGDIDVRVEAFLDALDRRTAIVQELTKADAAPQPAPLAATRTAPAPAPTERETVD